MNEGVYSKNRYFGPFVCENPETGNKLVSPFPVGLEGKGGEILGVATVIGSIIGKRGERLPVIAVDDDNGKVVEICGDDVGVWYFLTPEVVENFAKNAEAHKLVRISTYMATAPSDDI